MKLGERLAVVEGHYEGRFTIQQKSPISEGMESVTISDEELRHIVEFRGLKLAPAAPDKPNRRDDVRVALLASLTAAQSILKDAHERKVSPNKTMGSDKMFLEMLSSMEETMVRARREIWP